MYLNSPDIPAGPKDAVTNGLGGMLQQVLDPGCQPREAAGIRLLGETPRPPKSGSDTCAGLSSSAR